MTIVLVALITAGSSIIVALITRPRGLHAKLDAIDNRTARELNHNHGSSMKDDVVGMAHAIGGLERRVDTFLGVAAVHHPGNAELYLSLRSDHDDD